MCAAYPAHLRLIQTIFGTADYEAPRYAAFCSQTASFYVIPSGIFVPAACYRCPVLTNVGMWLQMLAKLNITFHETRSVVLELGHAADGQTYSNAYRHIFAIS
jgi:hypothetical protein